MKIKLKGRRFVAVEEIQAERQTILNILTNKHLQDAFPKWQKRWDRFVCFREGCFESDDAE
jgi:hypothetical protein